MPEEGAGLVNRYSIRLTVNKPAADLVFRNRLFIRFQSNLDLGVVRVCGTDASLADDTVATQPRARGGVSVRIIGDLAGDLIKLLRSNTAPFYRLDPADGDWFTMRAEPYSPARHIPWVRVWSPQLVLDDGLGSTKDGDQGRPALTPERLVAAIRDAEAVLQRHTMGRPTAEMYAARSLMDAFLGEVQRMGWVKADPGPVIASIVGLNELLEAMTGLKRTTVYDLKTVQAAVWSAEHSGSLKTKSALDALILAVETVDKAALDKRVPQRMRSQTTWAR